jgi:stage III sporulation protein AG
MDIKGLRKNANDIVKKNKYIILILLAGIVLMCFPVGQKKTSENISVIPLMEEITTEERLSQILSQVDGAGEVQVLLTVSSGEQTIYQTNGSYSENNESSNTVTVTDGKRNEQGLIKQVNPPTYLGAVVVCRGAESPAVRLAIIDAVSKITGLGSDKISVLKMK